MTTVLAYLALGSNQGDRRFYLDQGIAALAAEDAIKIRRTAPIYQSKAQGYTNQADFYNTVIEIETTLLANELLSTLLSIENRLGRIRTIRFGPRTLDIDLLFYGNEIIDLPDLQVPHPRWQERDFVIQPLRDLFPNGSTLLGYNLDTLWKALPPHQSALIRVF